MLVVLSSTFSCILLVAVVLITVVVVFVAALAFAVVAVESYIVINNYCWTRWTAPGVSRVGEHVSVLMLQM